MHNVQGNHQLTHVRLNGSCSSSIRVFYSGSSSDKASLQEKGVAPACALSASCVRRGAARRFTGGTGSGLLRKLISHVMDDDVSFDVHFLKRNLPPTRAKFRILIPGSRRMLLQLFDFCSNFPVWDILVSELS